MTPEEAAGGDGMVPEGDPRFIESTEHRTFHGHLDECEQCRYHPWDLCPIGAALLTAAARSYAQSHDAGERG